MNLYRISLYEFTTTYKSYMEKNKTYHFIDNHIYINSGYIIEKIPYYSNSPYVYKNIDNQEDLDSLLKNGLQKKPISYKSNYVGSHYIPNRPIGILYSYMYIPRQISSVYQYSKKIEIIHIDFFYMNHINKLVFDLLVPITIAIDYKKYSVNKTTKTIYIDFRIAYINQSKLYTSIRLVPIEHATIEIYNDLMVDIDLTCITKNINVDRYNNIEIYHI